MQKILLSKILIAIVLLLGSTTPTLARPVSSQDDMAELLSTWRSLGGKSVLGLSAAQARSIPLLSSAIRPLLSKQGKSYTPPALADVYSKTIAGPSGNLLLRVYKPQGEEPLPILVYFHGGGWVLGSIGDYDLSARALAKGAKCLVVSVNYRQAPEHRFPAAIEDAYAAFRYLSNHAEDFQGDRRRIAVAGEGAGANLATVVCLMAMKNRVPLPVHQLLICPLVDTRTGSTSTSLKPRSFAYSLDDANWFIKQYVRTPHDQNSPYLSPITKSAIDLPPATIITAELDPLSSQGKLYHQHLLESAVDSEIGSYKGVTADFFGAGQVLAQARKAEEFACQRLKRAFTINRPNGRWNFPHTHPYSTSPGDKSTSEKQQPTPNGQPTAAPSENQNGTTPPQRQRTRTRGRKP